MSSNRLVIQSMLDLHYPDYKQHSYLPPEILYICIEYLTKHHTKFYPNNNLKTSYFTINGRKFGSYQDFYNNGRLLRNTEYNNDIKHGIFKYFKRSGKLFKCVGYKNGKRHGEYKESFPKQKYIHTFYKDGLLHGTYKLFSNNKLIEETNYRNGINIGL